MLNLDIFQAFQNSAQKFSEKTALIFGAHRIRYNRLLDAINRLANGIVDLGVSTGESVAIMLPNVPQFIISIFALLKLGVKVVPINTKYEPGQIRTLLNESNVKGLIALEQFSEKIREATNDLQFYKFTIFLGEHVPEWGKNLTTIIANTKPLERQIDYPWDHTVLHLYTTGSTGKPNGVRLTHRNLIAQAESVSNALLLTSQDNVLAMLPFYHSFGIVSCLIVPLLRGSTLALFTKYAPEEIISFVNDLENAIMIGCPEIYDRLVANDTKTIKKENLKASVSIGSHLAKQTNSKFKEKIGKSILQAYGLTEAGPFVSIENHAAFSESDTVGFPAYGISIKILNRSHHECAIDEVGEIMISGEGVCKGYVTAENNSDSFDDGWFSTGDLGKFDKNGHLCIMDKKVNLIRKGGFDVYPREIEKKLLRFRGVKKCRVEGVEDRLLGQEVKAHIELENGIRISSEEIINYCHQNLPNYKCPEYVDFVDALPIKDDAIFEMNDQASETPQKMN